MGFLVAVRSVASVAYRKALDSRKKFHFDFFTIDFDEEYSALFGGTLRNQASFSAKSVDRILDLYKSNRVQPTSVIVIGQSMVMVLISIQFYEFNSAMIIFREE